MQKEISPHTLKRSEIGTVEDEESRRAWNKGIGNLFFTTSSTHPPLPPHNPGSLLPTKLWPFLRTCRWRGGHE